MTKFVVVKEEVCYQKVEVEAENLFDALKKVNKGSGKLIGGKFDSHNGDFHNWRVGYAVNPNKLYFSKGPVPALSPRPPPSDSGAARHPPDHGLCG